MIREICKDPLFLAQKAQPAGPEDLPLAADLLETLIHHQEGCVGMAANMIGVNKRIIAFDNEGEYMVMYNPEILKKSGPYETEEVARAALDKARERNQKWDEDDEKWNG